MRSKIRNEFCKTLSDMLAICSHSHLLTVLLKLLTKQYNCCGVSVYTNMCFGFSNNVKNW